MKIKNLKPKTLETQNRHFPPMKLKNQRHVHIKDVMLNLFQYPFIYRFRIKASLKTRVRNDLIFLSC